VRVTFLDRNRMRVGLAVASDLHQRRDRFAAAERQGVAVATLRLLRIA
jgi:hypothetical protein